MPELPFPRWRLSEAAAWLRDKGKMVSHPSPPKRRLQAPGTKRQDGGNPYQKGGSPQSSSRGTRNLARSCGVCAAAATCSCHLQALPRPLWCVAVKAPGRPHRHVPGTCSLSSLPPEFAKFTSNQFLIVKCIFTSGYGCKPKTTTPEAELPPSADAATKGSASAPTACSPGAGPPVATTASWATCARASPPAQGAIS